MVGSFNVVEDALGNVLVSPLNSPSAIARVVSTLSVSYPVLGLADTSQDALQKLEIIPKDKEYIDLTGTPPTSPRVKREPGVEREDVKEKVKIKREPNENNSSTDKGPVLAAHESSKPASDERNKKRKAMEDELQAVELEQKRMRLKKALADMENEE